MHILHILIHHCSSSDMYMYHRYKHAQENATNYSPDALDDATFAVLAADEERLHQALEDPATIRSGQALSIAKTKPRRQTVSRQRTLDESLAHDSDEIPDSDPIPPGAQGTVVPGDATSVVTTRGAVDQDDASTQVDEDMAMHPTAPHGRDWDKELPLSTDPAMTTVRRKSPKKSSILTLRDAMAKPKPQMTAVAHAVSNQAPLEPTVVPARKKRPTVSDV